MLDGQMLDVHFTRPIYKHLLGLKVRSLSMLSLLSLSMLSLSSLSVLALKVRSFTPRVLILHS